MKIETKFNIEDKVFILVNNKIYTVEISAIDIKVTKTLLWGEDISIYYKLKEEPVEYEEKFLFATKRELIDSL